MVWEIGEGRDGYWFCGSIFRRRNDCEGLLWRISSTLERGEGSHKIVLPCPERNAYSPLRYTFFLGFLIRLYLPPVWGFCTIRSRPGHGTAFADGNVAWYTGYEDSEAFGLE